MKVTYNTPLDLLPYDGQNGLTICCCICGCTMEETVNGNYEPIIYEQDKYNRKCLNCLEL